MSQTATSEYFEYWPRLTRFYGLKPGEIARLPRVFLQLYLNAIPGLEAEEQLERIQASDQPHIEEGDRKRIHRQLVRMAGLEAPVQTLDPLAQGGVQALAGLGVKVVFEEGVKPDA